MARKGRSLDQLGLKSAPTSEALAEDKTHAKALEEDEAWRRRKPTPELFLHAIEMMREDGRWDWCDQTLTGIYDTVHARRDVTLRQKMAIESLYAKIAKHWENDFDVFMKEA